MKNSRFQYYLYLLVLFGNLLRSSAATNSETYTLQNSALNHHHVGLFIFGDSLFDVGNNNYLKNPIALANFTPYGETYFHHPTGRFSDGRLIPDFIGEYLKLPLIPPYLQPGNHRFTDGANFASGGAGALVETHQGNEGRVVDLKTQAIQFKKVKKELRKQFGEYLKLPLIPPYLQPGYHRFTDGANFASAGAGALVETNQGNEGRVVDLKTQAIQFKKVKKEISKQFGNEETKKLLSKSIYLISIGVNDYFAPSPLYKSLSKQDYVGMVLGNLTSVIKEIYEIGGRKFGIMGLGVVECSPIVRAVKQNKGGCDKELAATMNMHNEALLQLLKNIQNQLKEFQYFYFDLYTTSKARVQNPLKYGFTEAKVACCGAGPYRGISPSCGIVKGYEVCDDVSEYVFFDSGHPTEKIYSQLAELIWNGTDKITKPHNLKTLLHA